MREQNTRVTLIDPLPAASGWSIKEVDGACRECKWKPDENPEANPLLLLGFPVPLQKPKLRKELWRWHMGQQNTFASAQFSPSFIPDSYNAFGVTPTILFVEVERFSPLVILGE